MAGGLSVVLYDAPERMWDEMRRAIPEMKRSGGYMIGSDDTVPESVSFVASGQFARLAKELGR